MGGGGWLRTDVYAACLCGGFGTRRPSNLEAFCKRPRGGRSAFYYQVEHVNGFYGEPKYIIYF